MAAGQLKERELNELEGEEDWEGDGKDDSSRTGPPTLGKCSPPSLLVDGEMFWEELDFFSEEQGEVCKSRQRWSSNTARKGMCYSYNFCTCLQNYRHSNLDGKEHQ